jgi:hypothetical protein
MARRKGVEKEDAVVVDAHERIRTGVERQQPTASPLGREHLHALTEVIRECTITAEMCQRCKEAGIDVEPEIRVNQEQLDMATKLKAAFFPHMS